MLYLISKYITSKTCYDNRKLGKLYCFSDFSFLFKHCFKKLICGGKMSIMKKRLLSLCLVGVLCFTLTGCGSTDFSTAEFNGETVSLGESKEDLQEKFGEFYDEEYDNISNDKDGMSLDLEISDDNTVMAIHGNDDVTIGSITTDDSLEDVATALGIETKDIGNDTEKLFFFDEDNNMFRSLTTEIPDYYDRDDSYFTDTRENFSSLDEIIECYPEINKTFKNSKYALLLDIAEGKVLSLSVIDVQSVLDGSGEGDFW